MSNIEFNPTLTLAAIAPEMAFVIDMLIVLATAAAVAIVLHRMRLAIIPAYLIAGVLVGPGALGLLVAPESLDFIGRLAIILLLFGIGLHLHLAVFGRNMLRMVAIGALSIALSIMLGWPVVMWFGLSASAALAVCMALSLSSTAVVMRLMIDRGELRHAAGQLALSILVIQDLAVLLMLAALPAIAQWSGAAEVVAESERLLGDEFEGWGRFFADAAVRIGGIAALIVLGRLLVPRILTEAARERSGEVMVIVSVATALGAGLLTQMLGFSMELGAFLAGFLLAGTPFRHQLTGQITPLRNLFLAIFFTTLGMQLDPRMIAQYWWIVLLGGVAMSVLKSLSIGGASWVLGASPAMAIAVGLSLAQAGEFSLVMIQATLAQGIIDESNADKIIAITVISLIITPAMVELGRRLSRPMLRLKPAPWIRRALHDASPLPPPSRQRAHTIIGGYGEVGRAVTAALEEAGIHCTIVEVNPETVRHVRREGKSAIFGDVANQHVLESAGLDHAAALILTMPDEPAMLAASAIARRIRGDDIFIAARLSLARHGDHAHEIGVNHITIEELETARALEQAVIAHFRKAGEAGTNRNREP